MADSLLEGALQARNVEPVDSGAPRSSSLLDGALRATGKRRELPNTLTYDNPGPDPWRGVRAVLGGAQRTAGPVVSPALNLLSRPGKAGAALFAGEDLDAIAHAFTSGDDDQYARDVDSMKQHLGLKHGGIEEKLGASVLDSDKLPGWARGILDLGVEAAADPLTPLGASGALDAGFGTLGRAATVGGVRGVYGAGKGIIKAADATGNLEHGLAARRLVDRAGNIIGGAHDVLTPGGVAVGAAKRALVRDKGAAGLDDFAMARQIAKAGQNTQHGIHNELSQMLNEAVRGLKPADEDAVYSAVDKGEIAKLPADLQANANAVRDVYRSLAHLQGSQTVRSGLAKSGFQLPEQLQRFDTSVRGLQRKGQVREEYLPHGATMSADDRALFAKTDDVQGAGVSESDLFAPPSSSSKLQNALKARDMHLQSRDTDMGLQDLGRQRQINLGRIASGARAIAARDTSRDLARTFAPGKEIMRKQFDRANVGEIYSMAVSGLSDADRAALNRSLQTGDDSALSRNMQQRVQTVREASTFKPVAEPVGTGRFAHRLDDVPAAIKRAFVAPAADPEGWLADLGRGAAAVSHAPKYAFFLNPARHMLNITSLAALENPVAAAHAIVRYGHAGTPLPEFLKPLWQRAVPYSKDAAKSQAAAIDAAIKAGAVSVNPERDVPGLIAAIPGLRDVYRWSGNTLWSFDDAQKATLYDHLMRGTDGSRKASALAAQRVGAQLIDYGDVSEFTRKLGMLLPFATYRSKLPGAVARAVVRHPERALAAARYSPALAGERVDVDGGGTTTSSLPLGEILGATAEPQRYVRSSIGPLQKDILSQMRLGDLGISENYDGALTAAGLREDDGEPHRASPQYLTYGKPVDWKLLLNQFISPAIGADQLLSAVHANEFDGHSFIEDLIDGSTGSFVQEAH